MDLLGREPLVNYRAGKRNIKGGWGGSDLRKAQSKIRGEEHRDKKERQTTY